MDRLIVLLIPIPLLAFWAWMFWEMLKNEEIPPDTKYYWTLAFFFLSLIAAIYYFFTEYRKNY